MLPRSVPFCTSNFRPRDNKKRQLEAGATKNQHNITWNLLYAISKRLSSEVLDDGYDQPDAVQAILGAVIPNTKELT